MEAHQEAIQECEKDIDAQWKFHLAKVKEITSDQVDDLVKSVASGKSYFKLKITRIVNQWVESMD